MTWQTWLKIERGIIWIKDTNPSRTAQLRKWFEAERQKHPPLVGVEALLRQQFQRAEALVDENREVIKAIADRLMESLRVSGEEADLISRKAGA